MPGPALHHMIADRLKGRILNGAGGGLGSGVDYAALQALLSDPKNLPYLFTGCQGPDILFFNTKDWSGPVGDSVELYFKVYDAIDDFKKALLDLVPQPVLDALDALGAAGDAVVENSSTLSELQQLFSDMGAVVDALMANLQEMIKEFITDFDIYNSFILKHPYRDGQAKGEWWWFDAMHYRKTGRFAAALLDKAPKDSPLYLYALGYLTHFTGDTVGHPYVNVNSGGPYRNQSARHKTGENYQDVFNQLQHNGADWNRSKIHAFYNFNFNGNVSAPGADPEIPDPNSHLPQDLAKFLADTINGLYTSGAQDDNEYGRTLSATDVDNAYRLYYRWLRSATDTGTLPPPVPYSLTEELEEVWETAMDNLGDIGDFLEDALNSAGNFSILGLLLALAALIVAAVAAAAALIDAVLGALTTLTVSGIRYAASLIYEHLYNAFQTFRLGVSLNGLAYPMLEHLDEPRFRQFKNTAFDDSTGRNAGDLKNELPKRNFELPGNTWQQLFHREKHLIYPPSSGEPSPAIGAPDSYFNATSLFYAFGGIPLNRKFIDDLAGLGSGDDDAALLELIKRHSEDRKHGACIGNAMTLTEEIFTRWKEGRKIPDFNMDADRGYAYPCWTQVRNGAGDPREQPEALVDQPQVTIGFIPNS